MKSNIYCHDFSKYPLLKPKGPMIKARTCSWNGDSFTGYPFQKANLVFKIRKQQSICNTYCCDLDQCEYYALIVNNYSNIEI